MSVKLIPVSITADKTTKQKQINTMRCFNWLSEQHTVSVVTQATFTL